MSFREEQYFIDKTNGLSGTPDTNQASELKRELRIILDAHEMLMIEQNGRPDCKNCVLAETIKELMDKEAEL